MNYPKPTRWESKKWRDAAKGQPCTMQLPGCNGDQETTVLAHRNGAGMGTKSDDFDAADMCSHCHDVYDGRVKLPMFDLGEYGPYEYGSKRISRDFKAARYATIANRLRRGILK